MLGLFLQHWDVPHCVRLFDKLTSKFFGHSRPTNQTLVNRLQLYLKCWIADGYYNVTALENCLKDTFGLHRRMFDSPSIISGVKVGITASTISNASTFVFSNYNGSGRRKDDCGKCLISIHA